MILFCHYSCKLNFFSSLFMVNVSFIGACKHRKEFFEWPVCEQLIAKDISIEGMLNAVGKFRRKINIGNTILTL